MAMNRLPIDIKNMTITAASSRVSAKRDFNGKADEETGLKPQLVDESTGYGMWSVELQLIDTVNEAMAIQKVVFPALEEPVFKFGESVTVGNLVAVPYQQEGAFGVSLSFKADAVAGATKTGTTTQAKKTTAKTDSYGS